MHKFIFNFYHKYEKYLSPVALAAGFIWDNLTLRRIDLWLDNLVLLGYLFISASAIAILNTRQSGWIKETAPYLLQFAFGGLFSAFIVFYSKSASFVTSWPFLLMLVLLLVGNEVFRKHYNRTVFHLAIFFVAAFSYSILIIPTLLRSIGPSTFLLGGLVGLSLMGFVIAGLSWAAPAVLRGRKLVIFFTIGGIYFVFHLFYFMNIIPPIPLSLKDGGVYHSVTKINGDYEVSFEPAPWYMFFREYGSTFHKISGEPVFVFSSVFAPTRLNTKIFHRWSYLDQKSGKWIISDRLGYEVTGGRDSGYRGFTFKTSIFPADWRVDVITERDQVLGRVSFTVVEASGQPNLESKIK